jgi:Rps23 Pro-64 3,4-dihydroxylase Tpa1-like proline 4-hydroxylase
MNPNLKLRLNKNPFPHLVIEDLFTESELVSIRKETDFLYEGGLSEASLTSAKSAGSPDGSLHDKADYDVVYLDQVYINLDHSVIETKVKNLINQGVFHIYSQIEPWADRFCKFGTNYIQTDTKINFFNPGHKYEPHRDFSEFTSLIYLYDQPKSFSGGLLNFPEFKFSYPCDHNSLILFPGRIMHEVTEVFAIDAKNFEKPCRISINTFYAIHSQQN